MGRTAEAAKCVVHLGRSHPREDPSCSGPVPTAKTTLNPAHVRPEKRALRNEPRLDDTIKPFDAPVILLQPVVQVATGLVPQVQDGVVLHAISHAAKMS